jgi:hypothetical protein
MKILRAPWKARSVSERRDPELTDIEAVQPVGTEFASSNSKLGFSNKLVCLL